MGYERYRQGQRDPQDNGPDRNDTYSSARDYDAAGYFDRGQFDRGQSQRGYGSAGYSGYGNSGFGGHADRDFDRGYDRRPTSYYGNEGQGRSDSFRGSYAHDGHRFNDVEDYGRAYRRDHGRDYDRPMSGYDRDRGFLDRAGDEVRSWFGDREAERRREHDARLDMQRDEDYRSWRSGQIAALDRDYDEYRSENRSKFQNEFSSWRTERQGQRDSLSSVSEHMDVIGSDGSHVGTVDKVRGDRIVLTKNDQDAGGRHHSIPSRWIQSVDDKVTLRKTADEAKAEWRDEERNQAFFSEGRDRSIDDDRGAHMLNRSFSGTY